MTSMKANGTCRRGGARRRAWACGGAAAAAAALGLVTTPAAAAETTARLAWSTYLRAGPAQTATALDELEHGVAVRVAGCGPRWCRVTAEEGLAGYIDRDALALPPPPAAQPSARTGCVVVGQADDRRPMPTRFCADPPARP